MASIEFDDSDIQRGLSRMEKRIQGAQRGALMGVGQTLLTLSQAEVPLDESELMNSGVAEMENDDTVIVGYNKAYAAYQHEGVRKDGSRPIKRYGNGRKGKYLEDPLKKNLRKFLSYYSDKIKSAMRG